MILLLVSAACGGSSPPAGPLPDSNDPSYAARFDEATDERVSTSRGEEGGVVVLWPRVITAQGIEPPPQTSDVYQRLQAIATEVAGDRPVDVRPEPQRVCPSRGGCSAASLGALVLRNGSGCAVVAMISRPGESPAWLVPWSGEVELRSRTVDFRRYPEESVRVREYMPCDAIPEAIAGDPGDEIAGALRNALGEPTGRTAPDPTLEREPAADGAGD